MPKSAFRLLAPVFVLLASTFAGACLPDGDPFVDTATLNVWVRDGSGAALNGATVEVRTSDGRNEGTQTTPTFSHSPGLAWFLLSNGEYTVRVTPPSGYRAPSAQTVTLRNNETRDITFKLTRS
jgi:hypothetical protein